MDFDLSEDQRALEEAAGRLLGDLATSARVRAVATGGEPYDRVLWVAMAEQGWLGVEQPESDGGLGGGLVEAVVLCEQIGRHVAPVPLAGTLLALHAVSTAEDETACDRLGDLVGRLAEGRAVGAASWPGPGAVQASTAPGGGWTLRGRTEPVVDAPVADVVVVPADGALFAVEIPETERPAPLPAMDLTRRLGRLELDGRSAVRLGGADAVDRYLDRAATATSAEMLGCAGRALEMAVDYAKVREQFGRPIGSFQAVKHRCADMLVDVEGMRSSTYYAAWCVGAGDSEADVAASAAKVWCSDAAARVLASALQVHGGIGFTWEHDLHLYLKRSQLDQVRFGTARWHRDRLAQALRHRVTAGLPVF